MSERFQCGDNSLLVAYMYEECETEERAVIAAHLAVCGACAAEIAALESTRVQVAAWIPPETDLGFVITRPATPPAQARTSWWFARPMPGWLQAAAAVLIFGTGLSLGILRGTSPDPSSKAAVRSSSAASAVSNADLQALEHRLRQEIAQVRAAGSSSTAGPMSASEGQMMARVRTLIDQSEQRQQRELALRTADIMRDFDSQRNVDMAQIQRNFGQMEGVTSAEVREQRQLLNYLMRVSQGQ